MHKILTIKDEVRVPPTKFNLELKQAIKESLQETIEGKTNPNIGVFLAATEILEVGEGEIMPEDEQIPDFYQQSSCHLK